MSAWPNKQTTRLTQELQHLIYASMPHYEDMLTIVTRLWDGIDSVTARSRCFKRPKQGGIIKFNFKAVLHNYLCFNQVNPR